jgi:hypothetical protein
MIEEQKKQYEYFFDYSSCGDDMEMSLGTS